MSRKVRSADITDSTSFPRSEGHCSPARASVLSGDPRLAWSKTAPQRFLVDTTTMPSGQLVDGSATQAERIRYMKQALGVADKQ